MPGWVGWSSLAGSAVAGGPQVGQQQDGRLDVFVLEPGPIDYELSHNTQDPGAPSGWTGWTNLGAPPGQAMSALTVGSNSDGRLQIFTRVGLMSTGVVWTLSQTAANGAGWGTWSNIGSPPGGVSAHLLARALNADGRLEVFALGQGANVWHSWQSAPSGASWSAWDGLGNPPGESIIRIAVGRNVDGRLEVFGLSSNGAIWNCWQAAPGGSWSAWNSLGGPVGVSLDTVAVGTNADGHLEIFAIADGTTLWHSWQDTGSGTGWSGWGSLGSPAAGWVGAAEVAQNSDGRLEIFADANDDALCHISQDPASPTYWSSWETLGGEPEGVVGVGRNVDGRLEVFAVAQAPSGPRPVYHRWQIAPNSGWGDNADWELTSLTDPVTQVYGAHDGSVYARTVTALMRSVDHGSTWTAVNLPASSGRVAVDVADSATLYSGGTGGLYKTTNRGVSWTKIHNASTNSIVIGIAVSEANRNLLYLAEANFSSDFRFFRSLDGGLTWTLLQGPLIGATCNWGLPILYPHPTNPNRVFRVSGCYAGRDVPFGDQLDHSANQGATFSSLFYSKPLFPSRIVGGKGIDPGRLYVSAWFGAPPGGGKLFASKDDGVTWFTALDFPTGPAVAGLEYNPSHPTRVYAGLTTGEVRTSADAGFSWTQLGHDGLGRIEGLLLDTHNLYAATDQGLWRYPLA
jgi:hypothetical protein